MAPSVKHRLASVKWVKQLITTIITIRQQKQIPNFERISRYLQRNSDITFRRIKELLNNAVSDGLIIEYTAVGVKGQRAGLEQEGYRIPHPGEIELKDNGHDWYCFECHGPGEVYECSDCFRVYHQACAREDTSRETFTCSVCKAMKRKSRMKRKLLNTLLSYTMLRLECKELYKIGEKMSAEDFGDFAYRKMDLSQMEYKVQTSRYRCLEEFYADAKTILHNCALVFGDDQRILTDLAYIMVRDCKHELDEIELCPNCYYMSNAKPEGWFFQPCDPPHDLVYAKQKGYCYWPAKVVKIVGGKYDVRFFGGLHQRALIPAEYIQPINSDLNTLAIKKSSGFQKSMVELKMYLDNLKMREQETLDNENNESDKDVIEDAESEEEVNDECASEHRKKRTSSDQTTEKEQKINQTLKPKLRDNIQTQSKKPVKRKKENRNESDDEVENEASHRQVTSTSVEKHGNKRIRKVSKNSNHDETVTSSVDRITNNPHITRVSTAVQTAGMPTESVPTQTDVDSMSVASKTQIQPPEPHQMLDDDNIWKERMTIALKTLTKRLEKKFEEDKKLALKKLAQQLQEDFGKDKQMAVERTLAKMKLEVDMARRAGEDKAREQYMEEMKKLATKHKDTISQVKKKQWCQFCEEEAMYHCCWNTSYCSVECQQEHWHKEHKRVCRRKRT